MCFGPEGLLGIFDHVLPDDTCLLSSSPITDPLRLTFVQRNQPSVDDATDAPTPVSFAPPPIPFASPPVSLDAVARERPSEEEVVYPPPVSSHTEHFVTSWGSPLTAASYHGYTDIVRQLLLSGSDVNGHPNCRIGSPLHVASISGHAEVVRQLLERGADSKGAPEFPEPGALLCAASHGHTEVVRLLLDRGADVNTLWSSPPRTALLYVVEGGHAKVVRLLLDRGADASVKTTDPGNTLNTASMNKNSEVTQMLLDGLATRGSSVEKC